MHFDGIRLFVIKWFHYMVALSLVELRVEMSMSSNLDQQEFCGLVLG